MMTHRLWLPQESVAWRVIPGWDSKPHLKTFPGWPRASLLCGLQAAPLSALPSGLELPTEFLRLCRQIPHLRFSPPAQ